MSCSSPFVYVYSSTFVTNKFNIDLAGSYTLNGYSVTWGGGTHCWGCVVTDSSWTGWRNSQLVTNTYWNSCCWQHTYPSWTIQLWPNINFSASVKMPIEITSELGVQLNIETPAEPFQAESITFDECALTLSVNSTNYDIDLVTNPIELDEENGQFSLSIELGGFESSFTEWGLTYELKVTSSLEFCLTPIPPVGWVNLVLTCELSISDEIADIDFGYSTSFQVSCPIVSVEEIPIVAE